MGLVRSLVSLAAVQQGVTAESLLARQRVRAQAWARFAVMKVARKRGRTLGQIARDLRYRDHTTIVYGLRRADELEQTHPGFALLVLKLEAGAIEHRLGEIEGRRG